MPSALSNLLTAYRTDIDSGTNLTNLPENMRWDDLPRNILHRKFALLVNSPPVTQRIHGGGVLEYIAQVLFVGWWDPTIDPEAIDNTIADDCVDVLVTMLTASNRDDASGVILVSSAGGGTVSRVDLESLIEVQMVFDVVCRETKDLS